MEYKPLLTTLFARYVDVSLEHCRRNFKYVTQLPAVSQVMMICKILEGVLPQVRSLHGKPYAMQLLLCSCGPPARCEGIRTKKRL